MNRTTTKTRTSYQIRYRPPAGNTLWKAWAWFRWAQTFSDSIDPVKFDSVEEALTYAQERPEAAWGRGKQVQVVKVTRKTTYEEMAVKTLSGNLHSRGSK